MKIIMHLCGGAGINIAGGNEKHGLHNLGILSKHKGFANIQFNYLDSSRANIDKITPQGEFYQVAKVGLTEAEIQGAGGNRINIVKQVQDFLPKYIDQNGYHKKVTGEYHIVVASASGASGSVLQPILINHFFKVGIPVIAVVIGDSSNALYSKNTKNTLASLHNMAIKANKVLPIIYANNNRAEQGDLAAKERETDRVIWSTISTLSAFLSGDNEALDAKDLEVFVDQSSYTAITIPPGLYGLRMFSKQISVPEGTKPVVARTLTLHDVPYDINVQLLHHKVGYITDPEVIKIFQDQVPLHLVSYSNFFDTEAEYLDKCIEDYDALMRSIKTTAVSGTADSVEDDSGLII